MRGAPGFGGRVQEVYVAVQRGGEGKRYSCESCLTVGSLVICTLQNAPCEFYPRPLVIFDESAGCRRIRYTNSPRALDLPQRQF